MPTYVYRCQDCGSEAEVCHGIKSSYDDPCAYCEGIRLERVIFPPRDIYVFNRRDTSTPSGRSITSGQRSGAPGIRTGFRDGYKSALARFPGDPKAYVRTKREAVKRAEELGIADDIKFSVDDVAPD